ncbi:hypothetical protein ACFL6S_04155 [Candidatus Poribacteria bacterium]
MESETSRFMHKNTQKHATGHSCIDTNGTGVRVLPIFRGYTVDVRLRQFRKADRRTGIEFIDFDSPEGDSLIAEYIEGLDITTDEGKEILHRIVG